MTEVDLDVPFLSLLNWLIEDSDWELRQNDSLDYDGILALDFPDKDEVLDAYKAWRKRIQGRNA